MGTLVYLSLGSNVGDRISNLNLAIQALKNCGRLIEQASVYETEAIGFKSDPFLNTIILIETQLSAFELLEQIQSIEKQLGRVKTKTDEYEPRTIDLDIIFFGNLQITDHILTIPHPRYHERMFVLLPLNQIASTFVDPAKDLMIGDIIQRCNDKSSIARYRES